MGNPNKRDAGKPKRARSEGDVSDPDLRPLQKHVRFAATPSETPPSDSPTPPLRRGMQLSSPERSYRDALESGAALPSPIPAPDSQPPTNPGTDYEINAAKPPSDPAGAAAEGSGQGRSSPAALDIDQPTTNAVYEISSESPVLVNSSTEGTPINCGQKSRKGKEAMTQEELDELSHKEFLAYSAAQRAAHAALIEVIHSDRAARATEWIHESDLRQQSYRAAREDQTPDTDSRLHSDLHHGSAPSSSRDPARPGSSSAARPSPAELFRGSAVGGSKDSILNDQSLGPDPEPEEEDNSALMYYKDGMLHSMPRSFRNESKETGDNSLSHVTCTLLSVFFSPV